MLSSRTAAEQPCQVRRMVGVGAELDVLFVGRLVGRFIFYSSLTLLRGRFRPKESRRGRGRTHRSRSNSCKWANPRSRWATECIECPSAPSRWNRLAPPSLSVLTCVAPPPSRPSHLPSRCSNLRSASDRGEPRCKHRREVQCRWIVSQPSSGRASALATVSMSCLAGFRSWRLGSAERYSQHSGSSKPSRTRLTLRSVISPSRNRQPNPCRYRTSALWPASAPQPPGPDLLDTAYLCQCRQSWYRDFVLAEGESLLELAGSARITDGIVAHGHMGERYTRPRGVRFVTLGDVCYTLEGCLLAS